MRKKTGEGGVPLVQRGRYVLRKGPAGAIGWGEKCGVGKNPVGIYAEAEVRRREQSRPEKGGKRWKARLFSRGGLTF